MSYGAVLLIIAIPFLSFVILKETSKSKLKNGHTERFSSGELDVKKDVELRTSELEKNQLHESIEKLRLQLEIEELKLEITKLKNQVEIEKLNQIKNKGKTRDFKR